MLEFSVTNEPKQSFIIPFEDTEIEIDLYFLVMRDSWIMDITFRGDIKVRGMRLNSAIVALDTYNLPFDIYINDVNNIGISPFDINNFADGFYTFNLITREELTSQRGYEVP